MFRSVHVTNNLILVGFSNNKTDVLTEGVLSKPTEFRNSASHAKRSFPLGNVNSRREQNIRRLVFDVDARHLFVNSSMCNG